MAEADIVDDFDDLEGTDLWELAQEIKAEGVAPIVSIHSGNKTPYLDAELIELDYGVSARQARKVKKLLERDPEVDFEVAAQP